ncbi:MAG: galactose-1-phosphate uridylyltransferase [Candidatus Omnitrophica bacterium]|nr:galactose-1-phosphate uridylyltransferase [Candidatus Omnitrophota bacterium]
MQELRRDPVLGRWIIVYFDRIKTPEDFSSHSVGTRKKAHICPFCAGNETKTPPEIYVDRTPGSQPNAPGWNLRVIANKFPALRIEGDLDRRGVGVYDFMNGVGAHEVIIETPNHDKDIAELNEEEVGKIILAYKHRCIDLKKDKRFEYILIFKNHGESAGASLEHSHSQLIALPIVPKKAKEALESAMRYYKFKERCVYCDIISQELEDKERVIAENEHFISFTPFASCSPFETRIIPKEHCAQFYHLREEAIGTFASILQDTLLRLKKVLTDPPFNFIINTAPIQQSGELEYYHWHIEIVPKLTKVAGFEWGSGFYINPSPPEKAAQWLKEMKIK